ncbi:MAG: hypothetical protein OXG82_06850 [Gammaproteobacteria bacterium]|nr:hypothetical protein [Gammaproteobacteria bacterium]
MGFWTAVALVAMCGCLLEAYRIYAKTKTARRDDDDLEARVAALESGNDLEERLRNLEAIVTDPKFHLDHEIKKLAT